VAVERKFSRSSETQFALLPEVGVFFQRANVESVLEEIISAPMRAEDYFVCAGVISL